MFTNYGIAAALAFAIGAAAWTLTKATISAPLRVWLAKKDGKGWAFLFGLAKCPYCLSHWLAFAAVIIWKPWLVVGPVVLQFLVTSFAIVAVAAIPILVIRKALDAGGSNDIAKRSAARPVGSESASGSGVPAARYSTVAQSATTAASGVQPGTTT